MQFKLVAFTGYGRSGKDEAAKPLIAAGYPRRCFGDIIKGQLDELVRRHLGFSAFTEVTEEKTRIRQTLQYWGEDNYDNVFKEFFDGLPDCCVNTRLCRLREAEEWTSRGGIILEVRRPGIGPETRWALDQLTTLRRHGLIHDVVLNDGTIEQLHAKILALTQ